MHTSDSALPQGGHPGLPGFPLGSIPLHVPVAGLGAFAGRCYVLRGRIAAALLAAVGVGWLASWAIGDWMEVSGPQREGRLATRIQVPQEKDGYASAALLDEAGKAAKEVGDLTGKSDSDSRLVQRRLDAAQALIGDKKLSEAREMVSSIRDLGREIEARGNNASLIAAPQAKAKGESAPLAALSSKVEALGGKMSGMAAVLDDRSAALEIRIVDGTDEKSGFWRTSGKDEQYFIIVQASAADGSPYKWKILDADSGGETRTARWAVSVTPEEFARLSSEKAISGKIQDTLAGVKRPRESQIEWKIAVAGKALSEWKEEAE